MVIFYFDTNIQQISENANFLLRNFTVIMVKTLQTVVLLNPVQYFKF